MKHEAKHYFLCELALSVRTGTGSLSNSGWTSKLARTNKQLYWSYKRSFNGTCWPHIS